MSAILHVLVIYLHFTECSQIYTCSEHLQLDLNQERKTRWWYSRNIEERQWDLYVQDRIRKRLSASKMLHGDYSKLHFVELCPQEGLWKSMQCAKLSLRHTEGVTMNICILNFWALQLKSIFGLCSFTFYCTAYSDIS